MFATVIFVLGILILIAGVIATLAVSANGEKGVGAVIFSIALFLGAGMIAATTMGAVTTRNVGVVTSFNKPTGEIKQAGLYTTAPWKQVHEMDLAWQTASYPIEVQAAAGTTVGLDVYPRWRIVPEKAPELFQNYRSFDGVVNNLFKTELRDSANKLFATYNPLNNIDVKTGQPIKGKEAWAAELKADLENRLAGQIVFERVAIPTIAPDPKTQEKLNQQVEEFGRGKVLDQQLVNAEKQKAITEKNASVDKVTRCLEIAEKNGGEPGLCMGSGNAGVLLNKTK